MANESFKVTKNKKNPFVMVDHALINYEKLSWQAKGILIYILSKPDNWKIYMSDIVKHSTNGAASVRSITKELRQAGFMVLDKIIDENGKCIEWTYSVFDAPLKKPVETFRVIKVSEKDKLKYKKEDFITLKIPEYKGFSEEQQDKTEFPEVENQHVGNPQTDKENVDNPQTNKQLVENPQTDKKNVEIPQTKKENVDNPQTDFRDVEKQHAEVRDVASREMVFPEMECPQVEDRYISNININNITTEEKNTERKNYTESNISSYQSIDKENENSKDEMGKKDENTNENDDVQLNLFDNFFKKLIDEESDAKNPEEKNIGISDEQIKENIEYEKVRREDDELFEFVNICYELIREIMHIKSGTIKVASSEKDIDDVKERFGQIRLSHIKYALECLKKNKSTVKNAKQYLLTTLYNSPIGNQMNQYGEKPSFNIDDISKRINNF